MLFPRRWPVLHKLPSIQLASVHLSAGKGPTGTFDADGALDDFEPWTGPHQPPHQPEIAPKQSLSRPQPNYEALHGLFGHLVELDQLLQLVVQGHRMFVLSNTETRTAFLSSSPPRVGRMRQHQTHYGADRRTLLESSGFR